MINNYDKIANQYDVLSRLVFFKSQVSAQIAQLKHIQSGNSILIVGGGTGWILEEIAVIFPAGLKIVYVEISAKMMVLSCARDYKNNVVEFINLGIEDYHTDIKFDVILTPFLFDNFSKSRIDIVFNKLNRYLKDQGLWLMVDFYLSEKGEKLWKKLLIKSVYLFFEMLSIVEAKNLIEMNPYFMKQDYKRLEEKYYYGNLIKAVIYQK